MKRIALALLTACLLFPLLAQAEKPQSPLQVNISPAQTGLASVDINPGDVVELNITGKTFVEAGELVINVELHNGVELISGATSWAGSVNKGEEKTLVIKVLVPKQDNGSVTARITMSPSSNASFAAEAEYRFGQKGVKKPDQMPKIKNDSKGRAIREYRTQ